MKREIKYFMLLAAMPLACFCTKNTEFVQPGDGDVVTITASIPTTKVSLTPGEDPALALAWEEGDQIVVEGTSSSTFTVSNIVNAHKADFTGAPVSGDEFAVYYPGKAILTRSYEGQIQDGNASTAHLEYNAMVEGLSSYENFTFDKVNGAVKLVVNVPAGVTTVSAISIMVLNADGDGQSVFYKTNDVEGGKMPAIRLDFTEGTAPVDNVLTAYAMVSWNPVELASGNRLAIKLYTPEKSYRKIITVTKGTTISGGETFIVDLSSAAALNEYAIAGTGTESDPYLLYDSDDMVQMNSLLDDNEKRYFKLMADVDMGGVNWLGENQSTYDKQINFDGGNHTIYNFTCNAASGKYPGLIGVLNGKVANVTFKDPVVSGNKAAGVICGYAGTTGTNPAIVENVTIVNGTITQNGGAHTGMIFGHSRIAGCEFKNITVSGTINQNGIGDSGFIGGAQNFAATFTNCHASGILTIKSDLAPTNSTSVPSGGIQGYAVNSTFENCSFTGTINGGRLCGGLVGYNTAAGLTMSGCFADAKLIISKHGSKSSGECCGGLVGFLSGGTIADCYTKGVITMPGQMGGGLVGNIQSTTTISNCWSSMDITAARNAGGMVARAASDSWNYYANKCLTLSGCVYWGKKMDVAQAGIANGSSGSIIGMTALKNVFSNCWRIADSEFTFVNTGNPDNRPVDQPDCDGTWTPSPDAATGVATQIGTGVKDQQQYLFPYWGKASDKSSISATVKDKNLGWDTDIWDIDTSKEYPTLKNNPEPAE